MLKTARNLARDVRRYFGVRWGVLVVGVGMNIVGVGRMSLPDLSKVMFSYSLR